MWVSRKRIEAIEARIDYLSEAVSTFLEDVQKSERRIQEEIQRFKQLNDEIDYRIERGNKRWREIRARERREEESDESEGLPEGDARGSEQEELFPMHGGMEESTLHPVEAARRSFARAIASNPTL